MVSPQTLKHLLCAGTVPDTLLLPSQPYSPTSFQSRYVQIDYRDEET